MVVAPPRRQSGNSDRGVRVEELVTIHDTNKLLNDCDELVPKWLNFIEDVVDSEGLPLNVYRETLHHTRRTMNSLSSA